MTNQITDHEANGLITDCEEGWGSLFLLITKPHQESCDDINTFIWRFCVSCRPLNYITLAFEFPISHCADSIEDIGNSCGYFS